MTKFTKTVEVTEQMLEEIKNTKSKRISERVFGCVDQTLSKVLFGPLSKALKENEENIAVRINDEFIYGFLKFMGGSDKDLELYKSIPDYMIQEQFSGSVGIYTGNLSKEDLTKIGDESSSNAYYEYKTFRTQNVGMRIVPYFTRGFPRKTFLLSEALRKDIVNHLLACSELQQEKNKTHNTLFTVCKAAGTTKRLFQDYPELYPLFKSAGVLEGTAVRQSNLPATQVSEQVLNVARLFNSLVAEGATEGVK